MSPVPVWIIFSPNNFLLSFPFSSYRFFLFVPDIFLSHCFFVMYILISLLGYALKWVLCMWYSWIFGKMSILVGILTILIWLLHIWPCSISGSRVKERACEQKKTAKSSICTVKSSFAKGCTLEIDGKRKKQKPFLCYENFFEDQHGDVVYVSRW